MTTFSVISAQAQIKYPATPKDQTVDDYFGVKVADPYRWLENDTSAATAQWVEAENKVTNAYLQKIPFRGKLLKRLKEVSNYEKIGTPFKRHGRWYVYKNNGLQNQSVLYVMDKLGGEERVFLDPNRLSVDGTVALKGVWFSHNGKYAAYAISRSGSDWQEFYVMDAQTGQLLPDHIEWAKFSGAAWQGDGFYYSAYDAPMEGKEFSNKNEGHKIYYHRMGTPQSDDVLFYQNPAHPLRFYGVDVNKEETMMFLSESGEDAGNNLYVRDLRVPGSQFIQMTDNMKYECGSVNTDGDKIYIYTNWNAPKSQVMVADIHRPGMKDWKTFLPEGDHVIEDVSFIGGRMVVCYTEDASTHAYVYDLNGKREREIRLPGVGSAGFSGQKDEPECFYSFSSFTVPGTVYRYDFERNESTVQSAPKDRATVLPEQGRHAGSDVHHLQERPEAQRQESGVALWLWRLQYFADAFVLVGAHSVPGERRHLRHGESAWRIGVWRGVARGRNEDAEAERFRRFHRGCRVSDCPEIHFLTTAGHSGRFQRRTAGGSLHDAKARSLPCLHPAGRRDGHVALS